MRSQSVGGVAGRQVRRSGRPRPRGRRLLNLRLGRASARVPGSGLGAVRRAGGLRRSVAPRAGRGVPPGLRRGEPRGKVRGWRRRLLRASFNGGAGCGRSPCPVVPLCARSCLPRRGCVALPAAGLGRCPPGLPLLLAGRLRDVPPVLGDPTDLLH